MIKNDLDREGIFSDASPEKDASPKEPKWHILESSILGGERVLVLTDRAALAEARRRHPDLAIWMEPEVDEVLAATTPGDLRAAFLRSLNLAKKQLRGWVVPKSEDERRREVRDQSALANAGASRGAAAQPAAARPASAVAGLTQAGGMAPETLPPSALILEAEKALPEGEAAAAAERDILGYVSPPWKE